MSELVTITGPMWCFVVAIGVSVIGIILCLKELFFPSK